jgi:hypothetical protein
MLDCVFKLDYPGWRDWLIRSGYELEAESLAEGDSLLVPIANSMSDMAIYHSSGAVRFDIAVPQCKTEVVVNTHLIRL